MPDYVVVKSLCQGLEITVAELMDGEETEEKSIRTYDDGKIMDLLKRTQKLEQQKNILYGVLLLIIGIALQALSHTIGRAYAVPEHGTGSLCCKWHHPTGKQCGNF